MIVVSNLSSHEKTLVLIKPDAVQRALIGEIVTRLERVGLKIVAMKMVYVDVEQAGKHYHDLKERYGEQVFDRTVGMITEAPLVAMILEGHHAIEVVRKIVGSTFPKDSAPGTIRGDFAHVSKNPFNLIHASGHKEDAEREIPIWFSKEEIHTYLRNDEKHVLSASDDDM